jgi:hypothetical protein
MPIRWMPVFPRHERYYAATTNVSGQLPERRGVFAHTPAHEPENDRIERFSGNECIEVGGYKPRPITLTSHRCASLGEIDGFL